jgi:hypothetical protein
MFYHTAQKKVVSDNSIKERYLLSYLLYKMSDNTTEKKAAVKSYHPLCTPPGESYMSDNTTQKTQIFCNVAQLCKFT